MDAKMRGLQQKSAELDRTREELAETKNRLGAKTAEAERLARRIQDLTAQRDVLRGRVASLEGEVAHLNKEISSLNSRMESLQRRVVTSRT